MPRLASQPQTVIDGNGDVLLGTEVALRRLDRRVPEQELDLLEVAAGFAAELMGWSAAFTLF